MGARLRAWAGVPLCGYDGAEDVSKRPWRLDATKGASIKDTTASERSLKHHIGVVASRKASAKALAMLNMTVQ